FARAKPLEAIQGELPVLRRTIVAERRAPGIIAGGNVRETRPASNPGVTAADTETGTLTICPKVPAPTFGRLKYIWATNGAVPSVPGAAITNENVVWAPVATGGAIAVLHQPK